MAAYGRPALRDLFDESPTPHIAHPPSTHHRDYYLATDGSFRESGGGLGVIVEERDGECVVRRSLSDDAPDNNVAEYRALHLGLDLLADEASDDARVGVLVDHDDLAANVNRATIAARQPTLGPPHPYRLPAETDHHWRGIRARIAGFGELRAARIESGDNPAHCLANAPDRYAHVNREAPRWRSADAEAEQVPPPSRADRHSASSPGEASD